uniref:Uncharacterized protein n=1 Tax=Oryza nivara TaxID=4536 RepID=A0A0E0GQI9_ORYNI
MARHHHHPVSAKGRRERRGRGAAGSEERGRGRRPRAVGTAATSLLDPLPLRLYSGDLHLQIHKAMAAFVDDDFELATELYTQAIEASPATAELYADRA